MSDSLAEQIKDRAREIGFDLCGIAPALTPLTLPHFENWLDAGFSGEMHYMTGRREAYQHPQFVLPAVRSVIMTAVSYDPDRATAENSMEAQQPTETLSPVGRIARYARGTADYHEVLKKMLRQLAAVLHEAVPDCHSRAVIDTTPLLERDFARQAGLGWFGKNTMMINKQKGSYFFLGALLTDVELPPDQPHETSHCGTCTRCLDICPTEALVEPHRLDARRCIAYLTIELRDQPIPREFRPQLQDWMFGCDLCQEVCPWNRHASSTRCPEFQPVISEAASAVEFLQIDEATFRAKYRKTPLWRSGRVGLARNAAIVLGNTKQQIYLPVLLARLTDGHPLVRGAVVWALGEIGDAQLVPRLEEHLKEEADPAVQQELRETLEKLVRATFSKE